MICNLNIIQIIILIPLAIFLLLAIFCETIKKKIVNEYYIYVLLITICTGFVVINWEQCVNMQFFADFNGYNIIFLVWLALLVLSIFKIDFNGIQSFPKRKEYESEFAAEQDNVEQMLREQIEKSKNNQ